MTVTLPLLRLVTTRLLPSGESIANPGPSPTAMTAICLRISRLMTETLLDALLAT